MGRSCSHVDSVSSDVAYPGGMCRNIRPLHNFEPPATDDEVHAAALQYVRKISGSTKPSKANEAAVERAVEAAAAPPPRPRDRARAGGSPSPARATGAPFGRAVEAVAAPSRELLAELVTTAPPKDREL